MSQTKIAIMYDFDKTLSIKDQQEYTFIPSLGMDADEFWGEANELSKECNMDRVSAYMYLMVKKARQNGVEITKEAFNKLGADVKLLPGVASWFKRVNDYGSAKGVEVEHYILSSGLKEIIEGTSIAKHFKRIYACEFHYNTNGNADWPGQIVNYTTKTQFIFRISKGALDLYDDSVVNSYMPTTERAVPYTNMIYIGDGITDVPCMKLVRDRGGEAVAIYSKNDRSIVDKLLCEKRISFACPADYRAEGELEQKIFKIIDKMAIAHELASYKEQQTIEAQKNRDE